jgi:acetyltransferase-like isoleucine patch superfamily enzyme
MVMRGTKIGNYCSIASGVWIHPAEHEIGRVSTSPNVPGHVWENEHGWSDGCKIGNDVWIGLNAIILSSCKTIGDGAVIAAGAVVNADIPSYAVVGGAPAKVLKYRFAPGIIKRLLASEWWNLSDEVLAKLPIEDMERFLYKIEGIKNEIVLQKERQVLG